MRLRRRLRRTSSPERAAEKKRGGGKPELSESERLLFGGPLRYDTGWSQHSEAFLELNFRAMVTVILITHRLASVSHADLVHVLDQGRLVESGTPDELLSTGGVYAELYSLQALSARLTRLTR